MFEVLVDDQPVYSALKAPTEENVSDIAVKVKALLKDN
jgi:hypothetical protein